MSIDGSLDVVATDFVAGWAFDSEVPGKRVAVEILAGREVIGGCVADEFREDLASARLGDGRCAFRFALPRPFTEVERHSIRARISGTHLCLVPETWNGSAKVAAPGSEPIYRSEFGGLWIDRSDWLDQLALKQRKGGVSEEESVQLFRFVRDGYAILPRAVDPGSADALNAEIEEIWANPPPDGLVETYDIDGKLRYVPPAPRFRDGATKLLDIYRHSALARSVIASPRIVRFLSLIFEDAPSAFQSLSFWHGSEQAIHKDTAYVKVLGNPLALAATWIALEDIEPGTGELEYFVGSHLAPDFKFAGGRKWMLEDEASHPDFLASLHRDAERYGHAKSSFLARKGDVLVWHADLAHGGSKITQPGRTRKSLVTHYCPAGLRPHFRELPIAQPNEVWHAGVKFHSQYGDVRSRG